MSGETAALDAIVIGGGFYGVAIADYLARRRGLGRMLLLEAEPGLCRRASYSNQARVHNGYHYPRSFTTAYRSRVNLPAFVREWPDAVRTDFNALYAISRNNSKVTARQFERFCREIGASLRPAPRELRALFEPHLVEQVFVAEEYAFDATRLASWAMRALSEAGVDVRCEARATGIERSGDGLAVTWETVEGDPRRAETRYVFNCSYSGLNQLGGDFPGVATALKHEVTEMGLVAVPPPLEGLGITLMDGPFFSLMPFPARELHTISHVRYTPHLHWQDGRGSDPAARLAAHPRESRVYRMLRDAARYVPALAGARQVDSLFEVKTVLARNEVDDGRPILFDRHGDLPGCYSILGGKIDNIFDALEKLDAEPLARAGARWEAA
jgi:glycine/D-amino acid oxidase-like deaminating enzyme